MMSHDNIAASAVNSLRVKALLDEVPKTQIAREVGVSRQTVRKQLSGGDMSLSAFIRTAKAVGADPVQVLDEAVRVNSQESKELAA